MWRAGYKFSCVSDYTYAGKYTEGDRKRKPKRISEEPNSKSKI